MPPRQQPGAIADATTVQEAPAAVTDGEPTRPRPIDANGRQIDEHGLPLNGPARARALAERQIEDPALAPPAEPSPVDGAPAGAAPATPEPGTQEG